MTDKDEILAAISAQGVGLNAKVDGLDARLNALTETTGRSLTLLNALLDDVRELGQTLNSFRAEAQDDFAAVKARLHRIETKLTQHEARLTALETRP
jgi:chromosome segregation ATPase